MPRLNLALGAACGVLLIAITALVRGADGKDAPSGVVVDKDKRTITVDCKIAPRVIDDPRYKKPDLPGFDGYPIEVIACWPFPKGQKAHETLVTFDIKPSEVHKALEDLGLKPGTPVMGEGPKGTEGVGESVPAAKTDTGEPQGPEVSLFLEIPGDGQPRRVPIEKTLIDPKTKKPLPKLKWRFTGSVRTKPDPNKDETVYGADLSGTLISIFPVTNQTVFQTNLTMKEEKYLKLETDKDLLPKIGTPVKLIIEVPAAK
jgi:hypothetical protein